MAKRQPHRTASSRMAIRVKFAKDDDRPILGDLVRVRRGAATRRAAGLEAGVGANVILDIENHYSAKAEEIERLLQWVGFAPDKVQTPPPIVNRSFGRPRKDGRDDQPILDAILKWMMGGKTLSSFESERLQVDSRRAKGMVCRYLQSSSEFRAAYQQARAIGAHAMADEVVDIADDSRIDPAKARNMMEARKWHASRHNPEVFGHSAKSEVNVNVGFGEALEQLERRRHQNAIAAPQRLNVIDVEPLPLRSEEKEAAVVETQND